jgi:hypothetical protein
LDRLTDRNLADWLIERNLADWLIERNLSDWLTNWLPSMNLVERLAELNR